MVPIVVKENQTVRGVKMSQELKNILQILVITFILLFTWNSAFGKTITMEVDGKEILTITVAEEEKEQETEEEPDCE
tara:strand:+ start:1937 stop:2167 length:231 start_codon:yes stop_codon:yes gene_type:complete